MKRSVNVATAAILMVGLGLASLQGQSAADKTGPNQSDAKGKDGTSGIIDRVAQASDLVAYARENESAVAMLAAAQMLRGVRIPEDGARIGAKTAEPGTNKPASPAAKTPTPAPTLDVKQLLTEAKGWAKGNAQIVALIDAELARPAGSGTLGATGGPRQARSQVLAFDTDAYRISFNALELAQVTVIGDGDTDLDVYVYDEAGNLIVRDLSYSDRSVVQWTPRWQSTFTIRIKNLGRVYNEYVVITN